MKLKRNVLLIAAALLLIGGFFLPNAAAGITDARRLNNLVMMDAQSISFSSTPELGLPEKVALVSSPVTEIISLKTGRNMDFDEASSKVVLELSRFSAGGPRTFDFTGCSVEDGAAAFVIDSGNPAVNMIVWEFNLNDRFEDMLTVTIDDETGVILKIINRWGDRNTAGAGDGNAETGQSDEELRAAASDLSEMMTAYYGLPVALADYQFSGALAYYRADLSGGGMIIPMYGVMRASGFTMNERLLSIED